LKKKQTMESSDNTLQQLMFSLIEVWKSSGKTQIEFCKEKDIAYHKFHYWFRKYSRQTAGPIQASFTRINVNEQAVSSGFMELVYPDGRKLVFNQHVDAAFLRILLA
jgi:hypothetical protein